MKWIGNRISVVDTKEKTTIIIYPEKRALFTGLMGAWIFMWYGIGVTMLSSLFMLELNRQENLIVFIFMTFWLYYAVRVTRSFLWMLWGSENIKIDETALSIKNAIKKTGASKPYFIENIKQVKLDIPKQRSLQTSWEASPWVRGGERIQFTYQGKTIRFGQKLNEKDATLLFNLVTKRLEDQIKMKYKKEKMNSKLEN